MEDLISVIVPVYKVEKYLDKCINSIINQTYKNLEIILIDDGSPDNSGDICDKYAKKDDRIIVIHKENGGVSSARNIGIKNAKGKWITFVDSDDWIENDYVEKLSKIGIQNKTEIVLCGYNRINNNDKQPINAIGEIKYYNSYDYLIKTLNPQTGFGFCHMKLIKKEIIKRNYF